MSTWLPMFGKDSWIKSEPKQNVRKLQSNARKWK